MPFVDALATGILARAEAEGGPLALAQYSMLLPTRRACRTLREAFLRLSGGAPQLLPRMSPLGDIDADELGLSLEEIPGLAGALDLTAGALQPAPATAAGPRHPEERRPKGIAGLMQAARLAAELGAAAGSGAYERLTFARLPILVPEEYAPALADHAEFLKILTEAGRRS